MGQKNCSFAHLKCVSLGSFTDVFQDLLSIPQMEPAQSFESLTEEETVAIAGSSCGRFSTLPLATDDGNLQTSSTHSERSSIAANRPLEITSYFDDMALSDVS